MKTSHGCWTCRLRRKKCDEHRPVCDVCASLDIKCHYQEDGKPAWMDGGFKQAEMSTKIKREIKLKAHRRRGGPMFQVTEDFMANGGPNLPTLPAAPIPDVVESATALRAHSTKAFSQGSKSWRHEGLQPKYNHLNPDNSLTLEGSNALLSIFYLEKVLPFMFPFYSPTQLQGSKAWILEMIMKRPAIKQAVSCQSLYFSLACGTAVGHANWDQMLTQTKSAYWALRESLKVIEKVDINKDLACKIRVMTSIMQVHRFDITILSFENWQTHLNAVAKLFIELLDNDAGFNTVLNHLGPRISFPLQDTQVLNAEQAAFRFSAALVIFDDIIASTVLQAQPKLYNYHYNLLCSEIEGFDPPIDVEIVFGMKSWVLQQVGEISSLNAWKQECIKAGSLDILKLTHRATLIKESLTNRLTALEKQSSSETPAWLDMFTPSGTWPTQRALITRVWAHAALLFLFTVISGWQPRNEDIRYHVGEISDLLNSSDFPSELLRTVVWPFCVAGCLAEPTQQAQFYKMTQRLKPSNLFGNIHKAFQIMQNAWKTVDIRSTATWDLAACFNSLDDLVLLV